MTESALIAIVAAHPYYIYVFFALFSSLQGPILSMLGGVLFHGGYLQFWPLYIALMIGDLIGDTVWYLFGRNLGHPFVKRFGKYFSLDEKQIETVTRIFHKYSTSILIISKMTMGFGFALVTLFTAGMIRVPYKKYIALNAIGQFVWTGIMIYVGYQFGSFYSNVDSVIGKVSLVAALICVFIALFGFGKYVRRRISKDL